MMRLGRTAGRLTAVMTPHGRMSMTPQEMTQTETAALRSRRMLLAGFGAAAIGGVAAVGMPSAAQAAGPVAPQSSSGSANVANGGTATELAKRKGKDGDLVRTTGYAAAGDGGDGLYRFVKDRKSVV